MSEPQSGFDVQTNPLTVISAEVAKAVKGNRETVTGLLTALLVGGHVILEGVPGVAKTLMVKALARSLSLDFHRVQFTPDLMPSDVTGNVVYEVQSSQFRFRPGPVFTNLLLADELNRTPPKTQAALLEAMEEKQVSVEGEAHPLPSPFFVIATQNPIEHEGTYPLPEAQLDRFLFKLRVGYPSHDQERAVLQMHHEGKDPHDLEALGIQPVVSATEIESAARAVVNVTVADEIFEYCLQLAEETRRSPSLLLGVSPRGAALMLTAAKAWAHLSGRDFVTPDDLKVLVKPAWRHRIQVRPEVELEGGNPDSILESITAHVPVPR